MSKIEIACREVIEKAEWVAIATSGPEGPHLAATWGEYIRGLGIENDEILIAPVGGYRTTERNLLSDNRIELLCATKQVKGAHGPGKGCRIRGTGQIQTSGDRFAAAKKKFPWARGVLVVKVDEAGPQL
jgi:Pyridoxamine 5'-phosphate oxidase